jgi:hypothetical protein
VFFRYYFSVSWHQSDYHIDQFANVELLLTGYYLQIQTIAESNCRSDIIILEMKVLSLVQLSALATHRVANVIKATDIIYFNNAGPAE